MIVAMLTGLEPGDFVHFMGSTHIYENHIEQAQLQLARAPRELPKILIAQRGSLEELQFEDFTLEGYDPHPAIRAQVAV